MESEHKNEPGSFVHNARAINNTENVPKWQVRKLLDEACDLIDRLKQELAEAKKPPETGELKYCKQHRTIHCSCQQREIDRLIAEEQARAEAHAAEIFKLNDECVKIRKAQAERIEKLEADERVYTETIIAMLTLLVKQGYMRIGQLEQALKE